MASDSYVLVPSLHPDPILYLSTPWQTCESGTYQLLVIVLCSYEKCISGKYLGEIVRLALQKLIKEDNLFGGKSSAKFDTHEAFETLHVSIIEAR